MVDVVVRLDGDAAEMSLIVLSSTLSSSLKVGSGGSVGIDVSLTFALSTIFKMINFRLSEKST